MSTLMLPIERAKRVVSGEITRVYVPCTKQHIAIMDYGVNRENPPVYQVRNIRPVSQKKMAVRSEYLMYEIGKTYSVCPQGEKGIGHALLYTIEKQDLFDLTPEDLKVAGYESEGAFFQEWCAKRDPKLHLLWHPQEKMYTHWDGDMGFCWEDGIYDVLAGRENDLYYAWALTVQGMD